MDQIILFDKSLQQRLQEYKDVLSGFQILPSSRIKKEWSYYCELTLDPSGWQAVWKIPRIKCESFKITFPSIVLVLVLSINYEELTALVTILAVQDDSISLPEKHYVSLIELWPTKDQDKTIALNLKTTANVVDMLRFFYLYVFMPWDEEEDDSVDWLSGHLETRLRLQYDLKNGIIPEAISEHIYSLLNETRRINAKRQVIESQLDSEDEGDLDNGITNKNIEALLEMKVRLMEIRNEMEILENPVLRKVVIKRQETSQVKRMNVKKQVWLVCNGIKADEYINFLQKVQNIYPNNPLIFTFDLASKLEVGNSNDVFILNEDKYVVNNPGVLLENQTIRGIGLKDKTVLKSKIDDVMFDFIKENIFLENLTIDGGFTKCAMLVRKGKAVINNCKLIGDGSSSTQQAIIILSGAQLELNDCEIFGFSIAITGNSGSVITLKNCDIHNVGFGLKVYDNCIVNAQNTAFRDCRDYGIVVETEKESIGDRKVGSFEILHIIPDIKTESVRCSNNLRGDVVINQKSKIRAVEDLFSNPELDPTIIRDDEDEEMNSSDNNLENTVLEMN